MWVESCINTNCQGLGFCGGFCGFCECFFLCGSAPSVYVCDRRRGCWRHTWHHFSHNQVLHEEWALILLPRQKILLLMVMLRTTLLQTWKITSAFFWWSVSSALLPVVTVCCICSPAALYSVLYSTALGFSFVYSPFVNESKFKCKNFFVNLTVFSLSVFYYLGSNHSSRYNK